MKFLVLHKESLHLPKGKKVYKPEEIAQLETLQEVLLRAEQTAQEIIHHAHLEAEEIKKKAKEEGTQEGLNIFTSHVAYLTQKEKENVFQNTPLVTETVIGIVSKLIGDLMNEHLDTLARIIKEQLKKLAQATRVVIKVNPEDLGAVETHKQSLKEMFERLDSLTITTDDTVKPKGFVIETDIGIINLADLDILWQSIKNSAFKAIQNP